MLLIVVVLIICRPLNPFHSEELILTMITLFGASGVILPLFAPAFYFASALIEANLQRYRYEILVQWVSSEGLLIKALEGSLSLAGEGIG